MDPASQVQIDAQATVDDWLPDPSRLDVPPAADAPSHDESNLDGLLAATLNAVHQPADPSEKRSSFHEMLVSVVGRVVRSRDAATRKQFKLLLSRLIAEIDKVVGEQLDAVLHHPRLRQLEGSWRALHWLAQKVEPGSKPEVRLRVLNVSRTTLERDVCESLEFDQSHLWRLVYENEFGMAGGSPYGLLVADYEFGRPDLDLLRNLSHVGAAAFAPVVAGVSASLFDLSDFSEMERMSSLRRVMERTGDPATSAFTAQWRALRESLDSRFLGLTLPRMLVRAPYVDDGSRSAEFRYEEARFGQGEEDGVWASAAWAMAANVVRSFQINSWPADIRGIRRVAPARGAVGSPFAASTTGPNLAASGAVEDAGGVFHAPCSVPMGLESPGVSTTLPVEVAIPDFQQDELVELGFIPLAVCKETASLCCFYNCWSVHRATPTTDRAAHYNNRVASMLQHVLCASRFAHYLKVMARDRIGSVQSADELELLLRNWIRHWSIDGSVDNDDERRKHPLADYSISVQPGALPGTFDCQLVLQPHFQLETLTGGIELKTVLRRS